MSIQYFEIVFEGHLDAVAGFLEGFALASGETNAYVFSDDSGIKADTMSQAILEWMSLKTKLQHVVIQESLYKKIASALQTVKGEALITSKHIHSAKAIKSASFSFTTKTYGKKYGEEIKTLIANHPASITVSGFKPEETVASDAKGAELYAPTHDYEFEGTGKVSGPIDDLLPFYKTLDEYPLIEVEKISLSF